MKLNIVQKFLRALRYSRTVSHLRHYRGYGVHSPYAYALERDVFLKKEFLCEDRHLYRLLRVARVGNRRAVQMQNMYHYCNYGTYAVDNLEECAISENGLYIATMNSTPEQIWHFVSRVGDVRLTLCVMYPRYNKERLKFCRRLIKGHRGMSLDNIGFVLYLYNDMKKKQHIKL